MKEDPIAVLLGELRETQRKLKVARDRLGKVTKSRDVWREKAAVSSPARRAAQRERMRAARASG